VCVGWIVGAVIMVLKITSSTLLCVWRVCARVCAVCGNGVCEIGESAGCLPDCGVPLALCPNGSLVSRPCSGRGSCGTAGQGLCQCFAGYIGPECETCASDHVRLPVASLAGAVLEQCVALPGAAVSCSDGLWNGNEVSFQGASRSIGRVEVAVGAGRWSCVRPHVVLCICPPMGV
jgi:hypothetical protein